MHNQGRMHDIRQVKWGQVGRFLALRALRNRVLRRWGKAEPGRSVVEGRHLNSPDYKSVGGSADQHLHATPPPPLDQQETLPRFLRGVALSEQMQARLQAEVLRCLFRCVWDPMKARLHTGTSFS